MSTQTRKPGRLTVLRDILSYLGGWCLIGYQAFLVPKADFNLMVLLLGGSLIGVPGIAEILTMKARIGTAERQSSPAVPDSE